MTTTTVFHKGFSEGQTPEVISAITAYINNNPIGTCCKFAMSDMKGKDARGVLFYLEGDVSEPVRPQFNGQYSSMDFETSTDYEHMFEQVATWMGNNLSNEQFFLSSIDFTNYSGGQSHIVVWFPKNL